MRMDVMKIRAIRIFCLKKLWKPDAGLTNNVDSLCYTVFLRGSINANGRKERMLV